MFVVIISPPTGTEAPGSYQIWRRGSAGGKGEAQQH